MCVCVCGCGCLSVCVSVCVARCASEGEATSIDRIFFRIQICYVTLKVIVKYTHSPTLSLSLSYTRSHAHTHTHSFFLSLSSLTCHYLNLVTAKAGHYSTRFKPRTDLKSFFSFGSEWKSFGCIWSHGRRYVTDIWPFTGKLDIGNERE